MEVRGSKSKCTNQEGRSGPLQRQRTGYSQGHQSQPRHYSTQPQQQNRTNPRGKWRTKKLEADTTTENSRQS
jgi:hypothetical protein